MRHLSATRLGHVVVAITLLATAVVACDLDTERMLLPFEDVQFEVDLRLPGTVIATGCEDGALLGTACFDPPVHPVGQVFNLSIDNRQVELADTWLHEGMLETREFGLLEFQIARTDRVDILATKSQIRKLERWLASGPGQNSEPASAEDEILPDPDAQLRYDGIYVADRIDATWYLQFFDDGTVVEAYVGKPNQLANVMRWFGKNTSPEERSPYAADGRRITFTIVGPAARVDFEGILRKDAIDMHTISSYRGIEADPRFEFLPFTSIPVEPNPLPGP